MFVIYRFKTDNKTVIFPIQFCLWSISEKFDSVRSREVIWKRYAVYHFSVDCNAIDKLHILSTHKYLMVKNNVELSSGLISKCLLRYWVLANP